MIKTEIYKLASICMVVAFAFFSELVFRFNLIMKDQEILFLIILLLVCCMPAIVSCIRKKFDPFEPIYPVAICTIIYYGLIVKVKISQDSAWISGVNYRNELCSAIVMALIAWVSFCIGYYGNKNDFIKNGNNYTIDNEYLRSLNRLAKIMLSIFILLFLGWLIISKVPLSSLWIFGEAYYNQWKAEITGINIGHLFSAIEAFPACILLIIATRKNDKWPVSFFFLILGINILYAGLGVGLGL